MLILPIVALFLFLGVFVAVLVTTMNKRAPAYDPLARMPLDDDGERPQARPQARKGAGR